MAAKSRTRYAILGVLTVSDCSGYDIKKYCDNIISHFWHENFGHLYPVLSRLLAEGAIIKADDTGSTRKKTYRITQKGKEEFLNWLMEPAESQPARSEFLLKLSFSNNLSKESTIHMIREYKIQHGIRLEKYREMEAYLNKQEKSPMLQTQKIYVQAPLRFGILASEAAIAWCDEIIAMLMD